MLIIPAIDIKGGKVVRLTQGLADKETVYSDYPLEIAEKWAAFGVEMIHIVDLDGALSGRLKNLRVVEEIAKKVKPRIELGGGIRDAAAVSLVLNSGIDKAVIGTKALDERFLKVIADKFKDRIVVAIDAHEGYVHTNGWVSKTKVRVTSLLETIKDAGIKTVNYTDISKDGMLEGPNIESIKEVLSATGLNVIVAGGVSSIEDVLKLKSLEKDGLKGMIVGKALYEKRIDLSEALSICVGHP
ncbi:MAG: 1-(5-phosphoribosyl)-5-[(5-phosphoribosylamino)methylideneamino]imidazole-4-carboxamide isomerase [Candidatus Omnitrophota bacterium]|nr:1-(5-phosphoribosyl)-5-[(5-phosphoribosylamino)methylideneamino]imidazole-4-carboxamide isomerase [Candidatus Omnitrophota bacterium]